MGKSYDEIAKENIEAFKDTRKRSRGRYMEETEALLKRTIIYAGAHMLPLPVVPVQDIDFVRGCPVSAGIKGARLGYHTAVLNFSDPYTPGGMVLRGEVAEEESLCRASNLYESLLSGKCIEEYYIHNRVFGGDTFTSRLIYSEGVLVFKGDDNRFLDKPVNFDVITIPFPLAHAGTPEVYKERIESILRVAASYGVEYLVLGSAGDPVEEVARAFSDVLVENNYVRHIVFAISGTVGSGEDGDTYKTFKNAFMSE